MPLELRKHCFFNCSMIHSLQPVRLVAMGWHFTFFPITWPHDLLFHSHVQNQVVRNNPSESFLFCADSSCCHIWCINIA